MSDNNDVFMSVTDAAKKLGLTSQRVSTFCRQGRLQGAKKVGHYWVIPEESVNNFVRQPPGLKKKERNNDFIKNIIIDNVKERELK